jgi:acyl carrier protein
LARRLLGDDVENSRPPEHRDRPMEERIISFLSKLDTEKESPVIDVDTDLFETGILDSFGFVELLGFLEKETGHPVTEEQMDDPRFTSVGGIVRVLSDEAGVTAGGAL